MTDPQPLPVDLNDRGEVRRCIVERAAQRGAHQLEPWAIELGGNRGFEAFV